MVDKKTDGPTVSNPKYLWPNDGRTHPVWTFAKDDPDSGAGGVEPPPVKHGARPVWPYESDTDNGFLRAADELTLVAGGTGKLTFPKDSPDTGYGKTGREISIVSAGQEMVKIIAPITEETVESHVVALGLYIQAIVQNAPREKVLSNKILKAIDTMCEDAINYGIGAQKVTMGIDMSDPVSQAKVDLLAGFDPTADSPAGEAARAAYRTFTRILRLKEIEPALANAAELVADTYDK